MLLFVTIYYIVHYFEVHFCSVLLAVNIFESNWPWWQMHKTRVLYGLSKLCYCWWLFLCCSSGSRSHSECSSPCLITPPLSPLNLETSSFASSQSQSSISTLPRISVSPVPAGERRKDRYTRAASCPSCCASPPPSPFIRLPSNSSLFSTYSSEAFYLSPIIGLCVHIK